MNGPCRPRLRHPRVALCAGRIGYPERIPAEPRSVACLRETQEGVEQRRAAQSGLQLRLNIGTPRGDVRWAEPVADLEVERHPVGIAQAEGIELGDEEVDGVRGADRRVPEKIGDPAFLLRVQPFPVGRGVRVDVFGAVRLVLGYLHGGPGDRARRGSPFGWRALIAGNVRPGQQLFRSRFCQVTQQISHGETLSFPASPALRDSSRTDGGGSPSGRGRADGGRSPSGRGTRPSNPLLVWY